MGKATGFLDYVRQDNTDREPLERLTDFCEFHLPLGAEERRLQGARCMDCGVPMCQSAMRLSGMVTGCPLHNMIPEWNDQVYLGNFRHALSRLLKTSNFPEFTGRVCPALCEKACICGMNGDPVTVHDNELFIIETAFANGWVVPRPPETENGKSVAVVGAGPAGLSAAVTLRRRGFAVTVYERRKDIGGLLRYGIPCFKLDKTLIDRRRAVLEAEGIRFVTDCEVGRDVSAEWLANRHNAVVVAIGTPAARDLRIPGRELGGIHLALELLEGQNRFLTGEIAEPPISAKGKKVLVIGGGDTGSDCVGTSIRQGAASVTQIEIMPKPPDERDASTPWPLWPYMLRTSSSHKEGCERRWNLNSLRFVGDGHVSGVEVETVEWEFTPEGRPMKFHAVPKTKEVIEADLVFLAMGFTGVPADNPIVSQLKLAQTPRTALIPDPARNIFCVGDCASGASLVVRALASGKRCCRGGLLSAS